MKKRFIKIIATLLTMILLVSFCIISVSAESAIRSASTGSQKLSNGLTVSGTVTQFSSYMYGATSCSDVGAKKRVINTYYYYKNGSLTSESKDYDYITNGFDGISVTTNFNTTAKGNVCGIKGKFYVKRSGSIIWSDTCHAGTV